MIKISTILVALLLAACTSAPVSYEQLNTLPPVFPDYTNIHIPRNIAPLNFYLKDYSKQTEVKFFLNDEEQFRCYQKHAIQIPIKKWKNLLESAFSRNTPVRVEIARQMPDKWYKYQSFYLYVEEDIDPYIAYRLIPPGYESWDQMGIYQRNLTNFEETPILQNKLTDNNCMNCHSFANYQPDHFSFHMRGKHAGTLFIKGEEITASTGNAPGSISAFTYPAWHPNGKYIAFSTNVTAQFFHALKAKQIEVFDLNSDIVLYDTENNELIESSLLTAPEYFETYPSWSPDGNALYFCRTDSLSMPDSYKDAKYVICRIAFDPVQKQFGQQVDTIYQWEGSCAFPRISPDGRFLLLTRMEYGCFPIWHKEADLCMWDLQNKTEIKGEANSTESESYHSWSSNGKWVVFSSRRQDELFTRLYFSHVDSNGTMQKAFLLPQEKFEIISPSLNSYNIPEFIKAKVEISPYKLEKMGKQKPLPIK